MPDIKPKSQGNWRPLWAVQTVCALLLMWMALDGFGNLWLGAIFSVVGAIVGAWLIPGEAYPWRPLRMLMFLLFFLRESFRGGLDVAWRAFHPRMPIEPAYVEHQLALPAGLPRTLLVGVISLLPGTLSVWLHGDGRLVVHALTPRAAENIADVEARVAGLFRESGGKR